MNIAVTSHRCTLNISQNLKLLFPIQRLGLVRVFSEIFSIDLFFYSVQGNFSVRVHARFTLARLVFCKSCLHTEISFALLSK